MIIWMNQSTYLMNVELHLVQVILSPLPVPFLKAIGLEKSELDQIKNPGIKVIIFFSKQSEEETAIIRHLVSPTFKSKYNI